MELLEKRGNAIPQFFLEPVKLEFKSQQEGRPYFEDREFVRILIPGDRLSSAVEPVNDEHRARWPEVYAAFKAGTEAPLEGTPLREWPQITQSHVKELAHFNIATLEQLAGVNDAQLQHLGPGMRTLRENAKKTLEIAASGTAPLARLVSENLHLRDENTRLTRDLGDANARIATLDAMIREMKHAPA